jgi:HlyD family secretion protein
MLWTAAERGMAMGKWLKILCLAAIATAASGYYFYQRQAFARNFDVQTVALVNGDVRRVVSTSGTVNPVVSVEVGSQLSGTVGELDADFGSAVKRGQVLARIEASSFETRVREEEAGVAIAEANVLLQQATGDRAQANLHKAELDLQRAESLVTKGATAQSNVDAARAAQLSAAADVAIAKAQVQNAQATLAQHKATLESARIDLERTYIRSPIDGVVVERAVQTGQTVAASLSAPKLFTLAEDLSHVQILAQVDESDIGQVAIGNSVTFKVDAYPEDTFDGSVEQIRLAPVSLQNVVTYTVVIGAENPSGRLLPGMTANVEIVTGEHRNVVVAANEALRFQAAGPATALLPQSASAAALPASTLNDRGARLIDRLRTELGLKEEDLQKIREGLETEFATMKTASGPAASPGDGNNREQARMRIAKVLRASLTPDQYRKFQELQRQRPAGPRRATLWTFEGGQLVAHQVRIGLADTNGTEVVDGLAEGARVVTRVREKSR